MFIPPPGFYPKAAEKPKAHALLQLKDSHLYIDHALVRQVFGEDHNVNVVYYAERNALMIAPACDELFKKLHKTGQIMLKDRNLKGDKTIALHEILIDNQLDDTDRELAYELQPGLGILNVKL